MASSEEGPNKWVYVKVKRKKTTLFLHIDLSETILEVKAKLEDLVQKDPKELKLFREGQELKDSTTLAEAKVENGDTLAMTYALPGEDQWEKNNIIAHDDPGEP